MAYELNRPLKSLNRKNPIQYKIHFFEIPTLIFLSLEYQSS